MTDPWNQNLCEKPEQTERTGNLDCLQAFVRLAWGSETISRKEINGETFLRKDTEPEMGAMNRLYEMKLNLLIMVS